MNKLILFLTALFLSSCVNLPYQQNRTPSIDVSVENLVQFLPAVGSKIFVDSVSNDYALEKAYYVDVIKSAFKLNGFPIVENIDDADYVAIFDRRTSKNQKIRSIPILNWQAPKSYSYNGYNAYGGYGGTIKENGFGQMQVVGTRSEAYDIFERLTEIICIKKDRKKKINLQDTSKIAWQMKVFNSSYMDDDKAVFFITSAAASRHIGAPKYGSFVETITFPDKSDQTTSPELRTPSSNKQEIR